MGMKNTLMDLNNHLFEQLERLNDDDLKGEELEQELKRSKAMSMVSKEIVNAGTLLLSARKADGDYELEGKIPRQLLGDN